MDKPQNRPSLRAHVHQNSSIFKQHDQARQQIKKIKHLASPCNALQFLFAPHPAVKTIDDWPIAWWVYQHLFPNTPLQQNTYVYLVDLVHCTTGLNQHAHTFSTNDITATVSTQLREACQVLLPKQWHFLPYLPNRWLLTTDTFLPMTSYSVLNHQYNHKPWHEPKWMRLLTELQMQMHHTSETTANNMCIWGGSRKQDACFSSAKNFYFYAHDNTLNVIAKSLGYNTVHSLEKWAAQPQKIAQLSAGEAQKLLDQSRPQSTHILHRNFHIDLTSSTWRPSFLQRRYAKTIAQYLHA